jgi:hypothetical protein
MYLKTALICEGMTVFDPQQIPLLDPAVGLQKPDCVWGHDLVSLAKKLSTKRPDFDLSVVMDCVGPLGEALTVKAGLEFFNPFFSELRYPQELKKLGSVGEDDQFVLNELVARLQPFVKCAK